MHLIGSSKSILSNPETDQTARQLRTDISQLPQESESGLPEQVSCPLVAWKADIDQRTGPFVQRTARPSRVQSLAQDLFHAPRMFWRHYVLAHAPCVVVHTLEGSFPVPYIRQETAPHRTWIDYVIFYAFSWILALFVPKVIHLNLYARCPKSRHSHAFRALYHDVPLLVRILRNPRGGHLASEWARLPRGPAAPDLPIPTYYGLFQIGQVHEMVLASDNGVTLDRLDQDTQVQLR